MEERTKSALDHNDISREVVRAAAQWLMRLDGDHVSAEDLQACTQWRQAAAEHEQAWQRAKNIQANLGLIPSETGMKTLDRKARPTRRNILKTL